MKDEQDLGEEGIGMTRKKKRLKSERFRTWLAMETIMEGTGTDRDWLGTKQGG